MEFNGLSELLPLGGASALLVYLLRILISERRYWVTDRARLVEQHAKEKEAIETYWRKRCEDAERKAYGMGDMDEYP